MDQLNGFRYKAHLPMDRQQVERQQAIMGLYPNQGKSNSPSGEGDRFERLGQKATMPLTQLRFGQGASPQDPVLNALVTPFMEPKSSDTLLPFTPLLIVQAIHQFEQVHEPYIEVLARIKDSGIFPLADVRTLTPLDVVLAFMLDEDKSHSPGTQSPMAALIVDPEYRLGVQTWLENHARSQGDVPPLVSRNGTTAPWETMGILDSLLSERLPMMTLSWLGSHPEHTPPQEVFRNLQWTLRAIQDEIQSGI